MSSSVTRKAALAIGLSLISGIATSVSAATWNQTSSIAGSDFFSTFDWFTKTDPTNGLVTYQSQSAAQSQNLSYVNDDDHFVMGVSTVSTALSGRNSVRIQSKDSYSDGVYVLNVTHVPTGCATWPAFWTVTEDLDNWPDGGEIDIMENANDQYASNLVSVHTNTSCTIPTSISDQTGTVAYSNCSAYAESNPGCRVEMNGTSTPTWGASLNSAGGGIIAMERSFGTTGQGVRVWYFANSARSSLPSDLKAGSSSLNPDNWGTPNVHLPISSCYNDFSAHKIIFDITLCGDWAANTYAESGCAAKYSACSAQVAYNGSSFDSAYWEVESLRLFTSGGNTANAAVSPQSAATQRSSSSSTRFTDTVGVLSSTLVALGVAALALSTVM